MQYQTYPARLIESFFKKSRFLKPWLRWLIPVSVALMNLSIVSVVSLHTYHSSVILRFFKEERDLKPRPRRFSPPSVISTQLDKLDESLCKYLPVEVQTEILQRGKNSKPGTEIFQAPIINLSTAIVSQIIHPLLKSYNPQSTDKLCNNFWLSNSWLNNLILSLPIFLLFTEWDFLFFNYLFYSSKLPSKLNFFATCGLFLNIFPKTGVINMSYLSMVISIPLDIFLTLVDSDFVPSFV